MKTAQMILYQIWLVDFADRYLIMAEYRKHTFHLNCVSHVFNDVNILI